ncbi:TraB/GumN family protein [Erythrobacter sp. SCSIO 43205]|uniref:TraB/GumN family protein n=1 Tax=Erythrobacter sp. SCSIO 43205 TaxID=2779361 RepID=UPI001CA96797|nr:TraB/GumN family protein [Erythrobacter sp. SCSIO 43205]UAB77112.1 TraB/GumN family protein [Erythrobacter sp. SCSIO 43205]
MPMASIGFTPSAHRPAWFWLLAAFVFSLSACGDRAETDPSPTYPEASPLLYEISSEGGVVEGWMFGTIHALPEGVEWRTAEIDRVIDEADVLMVEVASLGQSDDVRQAFLELSRSPGLPPVNERVSLEIRPDLEAMVARSGLSRAHLRASEDWAAAIMLSQVDAPGDPELGVDRVLIAQFNGRKVKGFETAREQLGIFDQLSPSVQRTLLEETVRDWASSRGERKRLITAWLSGDVPQLEEVTTSGIMDDPELRAALLTNRNDNWIAPITQALEKEPLPLIAVGTAHLIGAQGLAAQVQEHGYTVRRVQ